MLQSRFHVGKKMLYYFFILGDIRVLTTIFIAKFMPLLCPLIARLSTRGGCTCIIECNRYSSAHHMVCTFFHPFQPCRIMLLTTISLIWRRQSPDRNKHPRDTPTFLMPVRRTKRVPLHEVAHQGEQHQPQNIIPPRQSMMAMATQRM